MANWSTRVQVPGSLLAVPSALAGLVRATLTTEFGRRIFDALTHYGADGDDRIRALCPFMFKGFGNMRTCSLALV